VSAEKIEERWTCFEQQKLISTYLAAVDKFVEVILSDQPQSAVLRNKATFRSIQAKHAFLQLDRGQLLSC
jgi:hypothetical protein